MSTEILERYGEPNWWINVYKETVDGIREYGLPEESTGALAVSVPTLMEQARAMRDIPKLR